MHPNGDLEVFDERNLILGRMVRSTDPTLLDVGIPRNTPMDGPTIRDRMSMGFQNNADNFRTTSLTDMFRYIDETLITYQSWHYQDILDPWIVTFPYARYLKEGDQVTNRNTGEIYQIERILTDKDQNKIKRVKIKTVTPGGNPPKDIHRLLLDKKNMVNFHWSYVSSDKVQEFNTSPDEQSNPKPFTDTITFGIIRKQPGGTGKPFEGVKETKPRLRKDKQDSADQNYVLQEMGQFFDSLVELSCWSMTVARAQSLVEWFELFFKKNYWIWLLNGINKVQYWERSEETKSQIMRSDAFGRPLVLFVRTQDLWVERQRKIKCLDFTIDVKGMSVAEDVIAPSGACDDVTFVVNDGNTVSASG